MQKGSMPPEFVEPHRQRDLVVADELGVVWIAPPREARSVGAELGQGVGQVRGLLVLAPVRLLDRARCVPDVGGARPS
jgi:hypothetical protein